MMIPYLANEILIQIVKNLDKEREINSVCRANRLFYLLFNDYLYRFSIQFSGSSALLWAAKRGQNSTARKFLHLGVSVNTFFHKSPSSPARSLTANEDTHHGTTPLHVAAYKGHRTLVELFLDVGANPEARMPNGWTPLWLALMSGNEKIARTISWHITNLHSHLVDSRNRLSPLHAASRFGCSKSIHFFLDKRADINARDLYQNTPLHHALASSWRQLGYGEETHAMMGGAWVPSPDQIFQTVTELLDSGADTCLEGFVTMTASEHGAKHKDERARKLFGVITAAWSRTYWPLLDVFRPTDQRRAEPAEKRNAPQREPD